jgi:hypothetical protein
MDEVLIQAIRTRATDATRATDGVDAIPPKVHPVAFPSQVDNAERALGFKLPEILKALYLRVGNGGYGPGYGFVGLPGGATDDTGKNLVDLYTTYTAADPDDPHWHWPVRLLPVAHLGCAMYACLDCSAPESPVVWFEPNPHVDGESWTDSFIPMAPSVSEWLRAWLAGRDLLETAWRKKFGDDSWNAG